MALDKRQKLMLGGGAGLLLVFLVYRYLKARGGGGSSPISALGTDTVGADYAQLAGQQQSDAAALANQEQSDVASLQGALTGLVSQEQTDIAAENAQLQQQNAIEQADVQALQSGLGAAQSTASIAQQQVQDLAGQDAQLQAQLQQMMAQKTAVAAPPPSNAPNIAPPDWNSLIRQLSPSSYATQYTQAHGWAGMTSAQWDQMWQQAFNQAWLTQGGRTGAQRVAGGSQVSGVGSGVGI